MELKQSAHARATSMGAGALHSHRMSDRVASGLDLDAAAHAAEAGEKGGANGGGVSENAAERCWCNCMGMWKPPGSVHVL